MSEQLVIAIGALVNQMRAMATAEALKAEMNAMTVDGYIPGASGMRGGEVTQEAWESKGDEYLKALRRAAGGTE